MLGSTLLVFATLLAAIAVAAGAAWYYWYGRWYESTDNAYLTGNMVEVGSEIQGTVVWIGPEANDRVHQGQEILRLAEGDERENLALRKHELGLAVQEVLTLRADYWGEVLNDEPLAARLPDPALVHLRALDRAPRGPASEPDWFALFGRVLGGPVLLALAGAATLSTLQGDGTLRFGAPTHYALPAVADARAMAHMYRTIDTCPLPVIGRVQKAAFGGACIVFGTARAWRPRCRHVRSPTAPWPDPPRPSPESGRWVTR